MYAPGASTPGACLVQRGAPAGSSWLARAMADLAGNPPHVESCLSCSGPTRRDCSSCAVGTYIHEGSCVDDCNEGWYAHDNSQSCKECNLSCKDCTGSATRQDRPSFTVASVWTVVPQAPTTALQIMNVLPVHRAALGRIRRAGAVRTTRPMRLGLTVRPAFIRWRLPRR